MTELSQTCLPVWIRNDDAHIAELVARFDKAPKPMAYRPDFVDVCWQSYLSEENAAPADVDPDDFIRWTYAKALGHRYPRYQAMARWGVTVTADQIAGLRDAADFEGLIAAELGNARTS